MSVNPFGFQNLGNTCYMNSVLQVLLSIDKFVDILIEDNINSDILNSFIRIINDKSNKSFKQEIDKKNCIFRGFSQHDAHEFMEYIINEFMESKSRLSELIKELFTGTTNSYLYCSRCPNVEKKEEKYISITLELSNISNKNIDLLDCFEEYSKYERLDENNMWKCSKCYNINKARKKMELNTVPNIVIITLKRFMGNNKINIPVEIYEYIILEDVKMKLVGTVNHYGGLHGGHYVSHGLRNNKWYLFNDNSYNEVNINLKDPSIYIAIYQIDE